MHTCILLSWMRIHAYMHTSIMGAYTCIHAYFYHGCACVTSSRCRWGVTLTDLLCTWGNLARLASRLGVNTHTHVMLIVLSILRKLSRHTVTHTVTVTVTDTLVKPLNHMSVHSWLRTVLPYALLSTAMERSGRTISISSSDGMILYAQ
jgi:hypothetical protein